MYSDHLAFRLLLATGTSLFACCLFAQDEPPPEVVFPVPGEAGDPAPIEETIPAAAFLRSPLLQGAQLSPAGSHVAALYTGGGEVYQLLVRNLAENSDIYLGGGESAMVDSFHWLSDEYIAYNMVGYSGRDVGLMIADVNDPASAYPIYQYGSARIIGVPADSPLQPLVWVSVGAEDGRPAVARMDAATNHGGFVDVRGEHAEQGQIEVSQRNQASIRDVLALPEGSQLGYLPDAQGNLGFAYTAVEDRVILSVWNGQGWDRSPLDLARTSVVDVGDRAGELIILIPGSSGKTATVRRVNAVTGELGELLLQDEAYDFNGSVFRDPSSRAIVGAFYDRDGPSTVWFDEGYRELQQVLNEAFPGRVVRLVDVSETNQVMLVAVMSDKDPIAYFTFDGEKWAALPSERPWIDSSRMSATMMLQYPTADDQKLDAYVTLPAGAAKDNPVPLIVLPHGGPWARTSWGFNEEAQFLASRGYAVLQPNYRGSTGYDWMFSVRDRGDLLMMHDDVTRAVKTVLRTGLFDRDRVAISGGGFGGYLAITGLVEEPDLYVCGATISGVFDWQSLANEIGLERNGHPAYGGLFTIIGDPGSQAAQYNMISSGRRADQIEVPVFVAKDRAADLLETKQSQDLLDDLIAAQVPHEVHTIEEAVMSLDSRVALFEAMEAFFAKHLR